MSFIGRRTFYPTEKARQYINQILDTGRVSYGEYSKRFEQELAEVHGCKYGILSNSGTSSLLVALQAMKEIHGWQDGDEVIVPALTFVASVNVILQNGLKPVLVDVEPDYYGIDCDKIEPVLTNKTRCVIPVHTFGQPCDMNYIYNDLAKWYPIKVLADSCEAMFVEHQGKPLGTLAHITCFSTYMSHLIVTGVGGMAITDGPAYAKKIRSLCNHGMVSDTLDGLTFDPARDFTFDTVGHSFRATEFEAALGLSQLEGWQEMIGRRMLNAAYLTEKLTSFEDRLQLPAIRPYTQHAFQMYPIVCRQAGVRDKLREHLKAKGVGTRLMLPLTNQPVYRGWCNEDDYPVAKWINENGWYCGIHQSLTADDLDYLAEKIGDFFNEMA